MKAAVWGTPDKILRDLEARRAIIGHFELCTSFRFGGIAYDKVEASLRLFAKEVLPELKTWKPAAPRGDRRLLPGRLPESVKPCATWLGHIVCQRHRREPPVDGSETADIR